MNNCTDYNEDFRTFLDTTKNQLIEIGNALKGIGEVYRNHLNSKLPLKKEALKYCRHSKKRQRLIKWINEAEEYLNLSKS